jgi:hypothetical protein
MGVYKGVTTVELDELAAETAAGMTTEHPDYGQLSARIAISNLHKQTLKSFSETAKLLYNNGPRQLAAAPSRVLTAPAQSNRAPASVRRCCQRKPTTRSLRTPPSSTAPSSTRATTAT